MPLTHGGQQQQQHSEKGTHASKSSLDYPEVVLELGSGMGSVGLVAVEGLAIQYSTANSAISRPHQNQDLGPSDHDGTTKKGDAHAEKTARGSTVILTDLPEVSTLMEENVRMQMEEWEKRRLDNIVVDVKNDDQRGSEPIVNLKVRSLAWGNSSHVRSISEELRTQRGFDVRGEPCRMHILCSDLVRNLSLYPKKFRSSTCPSPISLLTKIKCHSVVLPNCLNDTWLIRVYFPHLLAPLLRTLIQLTSPGFISDDSPRASIIISYRVRSLEKETPFWQAFGVWFRFRPVLAKRRVRPGNSRSNQTAATLSAIGQTEQTGEETEEMMKGDGESGEGWRRVGWDESALSFLFIATRKPETMDWKCPDDDHELLHSRHHPAASGDDTFESLLLLCNEAVD
ncbi:hypothetical protein CPB86DRAFT_112893 [Serendipita vermifera]|nr:hypothetical protein CPB86DRAFT_112893 [Serendipita vermifera]